jgi:hypothetical protein
VHTHRCVPDFWSLVSRHLALVLSTSYGWWSYHVLWLAEEIAP